MARITELSFTLPSNFESLHVVAVASKTLLLEVLDSIPIEFVCLFYLSQCNVTKNALLRHVKCFELMRIFSNNHNVNV